MSPQTYTSHKRKKYSNRLTVTGALTGCTFASSMRSSFTYAISPHIKETIVFAPCCTGASNQTQGYIAPFANLLTTYPTSKKQLLIKDN